MSTFGPGQTLTAEALNAAFDGTAAAPPADAPLLGTSGTAFTPVTPGSGVALTGGALSADWRGGPVTQLGGGLMLNAGTLSAPGSGGSVTSVVAGAGLSGGTITAAGTIALAQLTAGRLLGNAGTVAATPAAVTIGSGLSLATTGTLTATGSGGSVTSIVAGAGLNGGTIITSGTISANWQAGTVTALGATGLPVNAGTLTARPSVRMQMEWPTGALVNNGTVYFAFDPPYPGTVNSLTAFCNTGSFTAAIQCNGTNVTGLGTITPTGTVTTTNATALNTFTAGQRIGAVITSASTNAADALLSLNVTWSN